MSAGPFGGWKRERARVEVPGTYTERGTVYEDWDVIADSWDTAPGIYSPGPAAEDATRGDVDKIAATFLVLDPRPIPAEARLTIRGRQYAVIGDAEDWPSPTGALDHQRVVLEKWTVRRG